MSGWLVLLLALPLISGAFAQELSESSSTVQRVIIEGSALRLNLATRAGYSYDPATLTADIRMLYATGRFHDVAARVSGGAAGKIVTFHVVNNPARLLRQIHYDPEDPPVRLQAPENLPVNPVSALKLRAELLKQLIARGYADARVEARIVPVDESRADVYLRVQTGPREHVTAVKFISEIGPYKVRSWSVQGPGLASRMENVRGEFRSEWLCQSLLKLRRESEKLGYVKFDVRLAVNRAPNSAGGRAADLAATIDRGVAYRLRRLDFAGNRRFSDRAIRANMLLDEGAPLDLTLLRKSLARLNQSHWFEPLDERDIELRTDPGTGVADLRIHLRERRPRSWFLSGPVGPMSLAGPVQLTLASRLPSWGRGILEFSTYNISFHLLAQAGPLSRIISGSRRTVLPAVTVQRPYSPGEGWKSGFTIAPQLGWRSMALNYGLTQLKERLAPSLAGTKAFTPTLPVIVPREAGEAMLFCEPAEPSLRWLRIGAGLTIQFGIAFAAL